MINYNTESMHAAGKTIQNNGQGWQSDLHMFWSFYQADMQGGFPVYISRLTAFMNCCKDASNALAQNRIDIGTKLEQAATAIDQEEASIRQIFKGHRLPAE